MATSLDERIAALRDEVDEKLRTGLQRALKTLRVVEDPVGGLLPLSPLSMLLLDKIFHSVDEVRPNDSLFSCIGHAGSGRPETKTKGLNLLPRTLADNLDLIRLWTNPIDHADQTVPEPTLEDAEIALNLFLRVLRWFYCEYDRGAGLSTIYKTEIEELDEEIAADTVGTQLLSPPIDETRRAIVIGISSYADETIPDLKYASEDARALAALLAEVGHFPEDQIVVLADEQATLRNIKMALADLRGSAPEDLVLLYFAGHGCADVFNSTRQGDDRLSWKYLVPHDAELRYLEDTALSMEDLQRRFSGFSCERLVLFLDSCYSGAGERSIATVGARGVFSDALLEEIAGEGRLVMAASEANELAFEQDDLQHGLFTYYLLRGLRGEASPGNRGAITVNQLFGYLSDRIPREAEKFGGHQHPILKGHIELDIPLVFLPDAVQPLPSEELAPAPPPRPEPLNQAETHAATGRYDEAIRILHEYLPQAGAARGETHRLLGQSFQASGDLNAALTECRKAVEHEPHSYEAHACLAECLLESDRLDAAIDACRNALEINPDGDALLFKIRFQLERRLSQNPDDFFLLLHLAQIRCLQGQVDMALEHLQHAIEDCPDDQLENLERDLKRHVRFFTLRQHARYSDLLEQLDRRVKELEKYRAHLTRGLSTLAGRDLIAAQEAFKACLRLLPNGQEAREAMAEIAAARKEVEQLQKSAREQLYSDQVEEALASLDRALALDRSSAQTATLRQQAETARTRALQLQEHLQRARDCEARENFSAALTDLDRALEIAPDRRDIQDFRGRCEKEHQRQQQVEELRTRAAACEAEKKWPEALSLLSEAVELRPGDHSLTSRRTSLERRICQIHFDTFRASSLLGELAQQWLETGSEVSAVELTDRLERIDCLPVDLDAVRAEVRRAYADTLENMRERDRKVDRHAEKAKKYISSALFSAARREIEVIRTLNPRARQLPSLRRSLQREEERHAQLQKLQSFFEAGDFRAVVETGRAHPELVDSSTHARQLFQAAQNRLQLGQDLDRDLDIAAGLVEREQWSEAFCLLLCLLHSIKYRTEKARIAAPLASLQEQIGQVEQRWAQDLPEDMVLVPSGYFIADGGTNPRNPPQAPRPRIFVESFAIDRHPVTNGAYREFLESVSPEKQHLFHHPDQPARESQLPAGWEKLTRKDDDKPVVGIDWYDAHAYAAWRRRRLPTEFEWEKAGFWDPHADRQRRYPWGDRFDSQCCNSASLGLSGPTAANWFQQGAGYYGAMDMCGNVWEWCADWHVTDYLGKALSNALWTPPAGATLSQSRENLWIWNPTGPQYGDAHVVRGGSWLENREWLGPDLRSRAYPCTRSRALGFRCALSPDWARSRR